MNQQITVSQNLAGFTCTGAEEIPEIRSTAYVFSHDKTGARLLHLYNDDPNNLFSIAFRTPVSDSTGAPHILEHSVLGGSRKFPLKDPFQELLKGSLQTFLNALTYPDKTVYPVSSQVEADFFNLVDVYCDAVFHPLLTESTFCQEGWHFDLEKEDDAVGIKGIVYNEMKGVFSDFASHVERRIVSFLFPDTSYFYESGGEPEHIPELTYERFKLFHAQFYHPSNAFIVLYGNIPSEKTLRFLDTAYLAVFDKATPAADITPQPDWKLPRRAVIDAPAPEKDNGLATIAIAWKVGLSKDPLVSLLGRILYRYLMATESSPLKRALIDSCLGEDLDDICGFETEFVHGIFSVGLRKSRPEHADAFESLVFETLKKLTDAGLDERLLEGAIRQTEFKLREITDAGRFPFNLLLAERCYRSWLYGGDPLAHLAFEKPLSVIRQEKNKGCGWFAQKIRELLINNPHYLRITVRASTTMGKKLETQSGEQARVLSAHFSGADRKHILERTRQLIAEQQKPSSPEAIAALPRLKKTDLPRENQAVPTESTTIAGAAAFLHPIFTSGIVYCDIGFDCGAVPPELLMYLPLYRALLTKCGAADFSYEEMSKRISLSTGGIDGSLLCETKTGAVGPDELVFSCFVHAKALVERCGEMIEILWDLFHTPDFSNAKQIKDILLEMRNDLNASIIDSGHHFAVTHASSHLVRSRYLDEALEGITQLRFLDRLVRTNAIDDIAGAMKKLHTAIIGNRACTVSLTADDPVLAAQGLQRLIASLPANPGGDAAAFGFSPRHTNTGIEISSSVNFVAKAWNLGSPPADSMGRFLLLSRNLSTGYLWDNVRVRGGAYGGMAMTSNGHPVFACASYRDPNLSSTLSHFEKGIAEVAAGLDEAAVDQSIIGTIGRLDTPRSPHEKGFNETVAVLCGRSPQYRQQIREAVMNATAGSLGAAARELLDNHHTSVTVLGNASSFDKAEKEQVFLAREAMFSED